MNNPVNNSSLTLKEKFDCTIDLILETKAIFIMLLQIFQSDFTKSCLVSMSLFNLTRIFNKLQKLKNITGAGDFE